MDECREEQRELVLAEGRKTQRGLERSEPWTDFGRPGARFGEPANDAESAETLGGETQPAIKVDPKGFVAGRERTRSLSAEGPNIYPRLGPFFAGLRATARSTLRGWT